jgi:hypothetical protein
MRLIKIISAFYTWGISLIMSLNTVTIDDQPKCCRGDKMSNRIKYLCLGLVLVPLLGGCASMAEGVTTALIADSGDKEDTRSCDVSGHAFNGLEEYMARQEDHSSGGENPENRPTLKVLMIHGMGYHDVGYSTRFSTNLTRELKLNVKEETTKTIDLTHPLIGEKPLGNLTVSRYFNKSKTRELIFYELTWSEIIAEEKSRLKYDDSGAYTYKRAGLNNVMKSFINSHAPDPMIYLGGSQMSILRSVGQSLCWMFASDWADLADHQNTFCDGRTQSLSEGVEKNDYAVVTHSLGSRIIIDALQILAFRSQGGSYVSLEEDARNYPAARELFASLQKKELPIFMLANQLPLLQLGRKDPEVTGQIKQYCREEGPHYHKRLFKELKIVSFSDPNDLLSYEITPAFADKRMDSRICPKMTNVSINIAEVISLFGVGELAHPGEAHNGYSGDDRVIQLIVHGIGHDGAANLIKERCTWLEIVDELSVQR